MNVTKVLRISNATISILAKYVFNSKPTITGARLYKRKGTWTLEVRFTGTMIKPKKGGVKKI